MLAPAETLTNLDRLLAHFGEGSGYPISATMT